MISHPVLHSFHYALDYLRDQLHDVAPEQMTTLPPGVVNHPAWIVGHLVFSCQMLGGDVAGLKPWLPSHFESRYGTGSKPADYPGAYESKDELLAMLADTQARLTPAVESLLRDPKRLDAPFPMPEAREVFPTVRHALVQVLVGHASFHVGQLSVWRRAMGTPPMARGFE